MKVFSGASIGHATSSLQCSPDGAFMLRSLVELSRNLSDWRLLLPLDTDTGSIQPPNTGPLEQES